MSFPVNKYNLMLPKFGIMKEIFTPDEVENIIFLEKLMDFTAAKTGLIHNSICDPNVRNTQVCFFPPDENSRWLYDRISAISSKANYDLFMEDIEFMEDIQYSVYDVGCHYDWHVDEYDEYRVWQRKISGVVFLTDPEEYEGGELEIITNGSPEKSQKLKPVKGDVAFFSSVHPHKVHPVTKGIRRTLVFWVMGKTH
jgi:PKHD-type hydroxylase